MPIKKKNYNLIRAHFINILGGQCALCGSKEHIEFDHIIPTREYRSDVSRSKREWEWFEAFATNNLQLLCQRCNKIKLDRPIEFAPCFEIIGISGGCVDVGIKCAIN